MRLFGGRAAPRERVLDRVAALSEANPRAPSAERERQLVRLRHDAFAELADEGTPLPEPEPDAITWIGGLPAAPPEQLSGAAVRAGIIAGGCLLVRGLVPPEEIDVIRDGIDRAFEERELSSNGGEPSGEG